MKCPYCKNRLDELIRVIILRTEHKAHLIPESDGRKVLRTILPADKQTFIVQGYICPECRMFLTKSDETAKEILLEE